MSEDLEVQVRLLLVYFKIILSLSSKNISLCTLKKTTEVWNLSFFFIH